MCSQISTECKQKPAVASYPAVLLVQGQNNNSNIFILNPDMGGGGDYPYTQRYRGINSQMEDMVRKTRAVPRGLFISSVDFFVL